MMFALSRRWLETVAGLSNQFGGMNYNYFVFEIFSTRRE